jgi:hypothetical protein
MSEAKAKKVVFLKMPSFTRLLIGGLAAYWLSTIMNPAFVAIAVLVILIIPILTVDNIMARQFHRAYNPPVEVVPKVMTKSEYLASKGLLPEKSDDAKIQKQAESDTKGSSKLKSKKLK